MARESDAGQEGGAALNAVRLFMFDSFTLPGTVHTLRLDVAQPKE